jgi:hypothetical protein
LFGIEPGRAEVEGFGSFANYHITPILERYYFAPASARTAPQVMGQLFVFVSDCRGMEPMVKPL